MGAIAFMAVVSFVIWLIEREQKARYTEDQGCYLCSRRIHLKDRKSFTWVHIESGTVWWPPDTDPNDIWRDHFRGPIPHKALPDYQRHLSERASGGPHPPSYYQNRPLHATAKPRSVPLDHVLPQQPRQHLGDRRDQAVDQAPQRKKADQHDRTLADPNLHGWWKELRREEP